MPKFRCRADHLPEKAGEQLLADSPIEAAEIYVERHWHELGQPEEIEVLVQFWDKREAESFTVFYRSMPVWMAHPTAAVEAPYASFAEIDAEAGAGQ